MTWNSWSDFFHMGGYAFYIWGSYGLAALVITGEIVLLRLHRQQALEQARHAAKFVSLQNENNETSA